MLNVACVVTYFILWVSELAYCMVLCGGGAVARHGRVAMRSALWAPEGRRWLSSARSRALQLFFVLRAFNNLKHLPYNGMRMANLTTRIQVGQGKACAG